MDGELVDVINNMPLVRAFGATLRERSRFAESVQRERAARGRSLRYLEKLRLFHAGVPRCSALDCSPGRSRCGSRGRPALVMSCS